MMMIARRVSLNHHSICLHNDVAENPRSRGLANESTHYRDDGFEPMAVAWKWSFEKLPNFFQWIAQAKKVGTAGLLMATSDTSFLTIFTSKV